MTYLDIYNIEGGNPYVQKIKKFISDNSSLFAIILAITIVVLIGLIYHVLANSKECGICPAPQPCPICPPEKVCVHDPSKCVHDPSKCVNTTSAVSIPAASTPAASTGVDSTPAAATPVASTPVDSSINNEDNEDNKDNELPSSEFSNYENFTNDLPYQLNNVTVKYSSNEDTDYNELLQDMALDNDVKSQHKQYVTDRNKVTSTASFVPARSDTQDIVPRWGLSANTYIPIDSSAREIPSQDPEQGPKPVRLRWN